MKRFFAGFAGVLGCCAALVACGGTEATGGTAGTGGSSGGSGGTGATGGTGGTGASGGSGGGTTKAAACDKFTSAVCEKVDMCAPFVMALAYGDKATCLTRANLACVASFDLDGATITPESMTACADAYSATACGALFGGTPPAGCDFKGTKDDGAGCSSGTQCKSGHCSTTGGEQCGTCATLPGEGAACSANSECASLLYCDAANKCQKRAVKGEACDPMKPCSGGTACVGGKCDTPLGEGATCAGAECDVLQGLSCDSQTKKCGAIGLAKIGAKCGFDAATGKFTTCAGGGSCDSATEVCVADIADGAACSNMGPSCLPVAACLDGKCSVEPPVCK